MPTKEYLTDLFVYHDDGTVTRRRNHYCAKKGDIAGFKNMHGYWFVKVNRLRVPTHRIVWIMHNGDIPDGHVIDHINRVRDDNRISNLRIATYKTNARNQSLRAENSAGARGVSFNKRSKKWVARIRNDGREIIVGIFDKKEYAIVARHVAERLCGYTLIRDVNDILREETN